MTHLSRSLSILLVLVLVVVPAGAAELTVFHQDYTALGGVPDNIVVLNAEKPYKATRTALYDGGAVIDRVSYGTAKGDMVVGGLSPGTVIKYSILMDLDRTNSNSAVIIRGAGIGVTVQKLASEALRIRSYYHRPDGASTSSYVDVPSSAYPRPFSVTIDFDGINQRVTAGAHGYSVMTPMDGKAVPNYHQLSGTIIRFDPEPARTGEMTVRLYGITETVTRKGVITAIGDPKLVSFGMDGPCAPGTWENSAAAVTASGGQYTIWADTSGLAHYPQNVAAVTSLLNQGYELGIHFSQRLSDHPNPYPVIDQETAQITALFGRQPTSWCALQNADNGTLATYIYNKYGMIWRNGQMGVGELPNVPNLYEDPWPWWDAATQAGITIRAFTHQTDVARPIIYSIGPQHFATFLSRYHARGMTLTPFINWYKVGANTCDATFTENTDSSASLNFTAHTNGYPARVEVDLPYADGNRVYNVSDGMSTVRCIEAIDGKMQFYVSDGSTYCITALPPPPLSADFTANVTSGPVPLAVQFTDTSTGVPTSWSWTFGDGGTSTLQNPVHTYTMTGTYQVALTVTNAEGSDITTKSGYTAVDPQVLPTVTATVTPTVTATPAAQTASIRFTSKPAGGTIYLDGVYQGLTPATITGIPLGVHRTEIAYPGYTSWIKSISVTSADVNRTPPSSYNPTLTRLPSTPTPKAGGG